MPRNTIDLLRHGAVQGERKFRGITDEPLSAAGWRQMYDAVENLERADLIVCSPLQRCKDFAQAVSKTQQIELVVEKAFQEIDFGVWEGLTAEQIKALDASALLRFYQDPENNAPEAGERFSQFFQRIANGWEDIAARFPDRYILIVTHAGVIRVFFSLFTGVPTNHLFSIQLNYASLTRFTCIAEQNQLYYQLVSHHSGLEHGRKPVLSCPLR